MVASLKEMKQYKNTAVFKRYEKEFLNNKLTAEQAFYGVIQYLWLCKKHEMDKKENPNNDAFNFVCGVYPEMREIDDMWHTFLLFTKEYADFCANYFGEFMHHVPETEDNPSPKLTDTEFSRYLSYIYDNLGEATVRIWFSDLID